MNSTRPTRRQAAANILACLVLILLVSDGNHAYRYRQWRGRRVNQAPRRQQNNPIRATNAVAPTIINKILINTKQNVNEDGHNEIELPPGGAPNNHSDPNRPKDSPLEGAAGPKSGDSEQDHSDWLKRAEMSLQSLDDEQLMAALRARRAEGQTQGVDSGEVQHHRQVSGAQLEGGCPLNANGQPSCKLASRTPESHYREPLSPVEPVSYPSSEVLDHGSQPVGLHSGDLPNYHHRVSAPQNHGGCPLDANGHPSCRLAASHQSPEDLYRGRPLSPPVSYPPSDSFEYAPRYLSERQLLYSALARSEEQRRLAEHQRDGPNGMPNGIHQYYDLARAETSGQWTTGGASTSSGIY